MSTNGAVVIQGCAYRITRLNADGSCATGAMAKVQDDIPLVKVTAKPNLVQGVDITPVSACGVPTISFKDCDRYKRWDFQLDISDWDPEQMELLAGGSVISGTTSAGRTFADGQVTINENTLTSPALATFLTTDVGRGVTGTGIPTNTYIAEYVSPTVVRMSAVATATGTGLSIVLGSSSGGTIGYQFPRLLQTACPNGVSLEVWGKQIVRHTGYQGTTPYPSAGTATIPGSAWVRFGIFRILGLTHMDQTIENKEMPFSFSGWAIENPNFGTGPEDDWRVSGVTGVGTPIDTTAWCDQMADFALPTPLAPGYQSVP